MSGQLGIVELGDVCAAMRAHSLALFAQIGAWVATTSPGEQQRLFAEACHRHAWHADLWEARAPTIPTAHATSPPSAAPSTVDDDNTRRERYRAELSSLEDQLRSLRSRIDPALDPSTARTIDLVGRDVVEIAERLDALRTR
jgi:hypothetical protein